MAGQTRRGRGGNRAGNGLFPGCCAARRTESAFTRVFDALNRTSRRLTLTDAAQSYIQACRRILEELDEAERVVSANTARRKANSPSRHPWCSAAFMWCR
jgi:hypothetical protein